MTDTYKIELTTTENHPKRGVAFLISDDTRITAEKSFHKLNENNKQFFNSIFDQWVGGRERPNKKWFHGWDKSQFKGKYTECFVFKCSIGRKCGHRLYGFLCKTITNRPGYLLCVLVAYALKDERETDERDLELTEILRTDQNINKAVADYFKGKIYE